MKKNMGTLDRILRTLVAVVILWLCYKGILVGLTAVVLFVVATVFLLTSIFGNCPLYTLLGINRKSAPAYNW